MAQSFPEASVIKACWQPGCTSCLRMKEFLTKHGVPFVSVNVLEDKDAFAELAMLGIRSVPIVRRGKDWANGQVLREVARVAGIAWGGAHVLPAPELARHELYRILPSSWPVCRPSSQGREARRFAGGASNQVRTPR
jgi:glutaredoxin